MLAKLHTLSLLGVDGELALDGSTRPVKGALSMAMAAVNVGASLRDSHSRLGETRPRVRGIIVPSVNASEAAISSRASKSSRSIASRKRSPFSPAR